MAHSTCYTFCVQMEITCPLLTPNSPAQRDKEVDSVLRESSEAGGVTGEVLSET